MEISSRYTFRPFYYKSRPSNWPDIQSDFIIF